MSVRPKKSRKKKTNPLFIVTNNGSTVEQAESMIDAFVKKFNLKPVFDFLNSIIGMIMETVGGNVALEIAKGFVDEVVDYLEKVMKTIDPVMAFSFFKR